MMSGGFVLKGVEVEPTAGTTNFSVLAPSTSSTPPEFLQELTNQAPEPLVTPPMTKSKCDCPNCRVGGQVSGQKVHVCHLRGCKKSYRRTSHLRAHIRSHNGERPHPCKKAFTRSDDLQRHTRIHTGEITHVCVCKKGFTRSDHLKKHQKTHFKERKARVVNELPRIVYGGVYQPVIPQQQDYETAQSNYLIEQFHNQMDPEPPDLVPLIPADQVQYYVFENESCSFIFL